MITQNPTKWEYKAILLPSSKENPADTARLKELTETLNKAGAEYWEPFDLSKHLPGGYILVRRSSEAPAITSVAPKRRLFDPLPRVVIAQPNVVASQPKIAVPLTK